MPHTAAATLKFFPVQAGVGSKMRPTGIPEPFAPGETLPLNRTVLISGDIVELHVEDIYCASQIRE